MRLYAWLWSVALLGAYVAADWLYRTFLPDLYNPLAAAAGVVLLCVVIVVRWVRGDFHKAWLERQARSANRNSRR
ncbi:hypothetical protein AB6T85_22540 [Erwinia sp. ACCC 02193]|uniref:DUF4175 domain-containing protein n=1 Tax=Erwinia aeris TaxID=3239803 RepID=A0ABV4EE14_9GAMM